LRMLPNTLATKVPLESKKKFLTVCEIVDEYGGSVSAWRKRILRKEIRYYKAGRSVFVARADLDRWFAERVVEPVGRSSVGKQGTEGRRARSTAQADGGDRNA